MEKIHNITAQLLNQFLQMKVDVLSYDELIFLQVFLISPLEPVKGEMFPIFTIDLAKWSKKSALFSAYCFTKANDSRLLVVRTWSEFNRPFEANKSLK